MSTSPIGIDPPPAQEAAPLGATFKANDCTQCPPMFDLPEELWLTVLESPCTFSPDIFATVMLNLIKNPNITSSHLFRADVLYDSDKPHGQLSMVEGSLTKHLQPVYRPWDYDLPGYTRSRTIVRQLVPRNVQLDKPLVQTCHFYYRFNNNEEQNVVVYLPHIERTEDMPFYHPSVSRLAFTHTSHSSPSADSANSISISYSLFPGTALTPKLSRTALRLLQTVHKHGQGQLAGYEKRVHLDQIIPQKRYQDTYARLKLKYGKRLSEQWVEVTDPGKHVFEDLGIAAFLIELWREMYRLPGVAETGNGSNGENMDRPPFPGFVDIGAGNGVLVNILLSEGYSGWGFDARERKTWTTFPEDIRSRLQQRLLVPQIFRGATSTTDADPSWHNGVFEPGTFIISNHADELTAWSPLLAYLNQSAFIAIPCCSHDLSGARFRAPATTKAAKAVVARLPQQAPSNGRCHSQAAETGSLKRTEAQKKMPSAYSTLCSYVSSLTEEIGFRPEREVLRIPSTRNQCIIGRKLVKDAGDADGEIANAGAEDLALRLRVIENVIERELGRSLREVGAEWIARAEKLAMKPGSGH